jgi:hypothetical protein
MYFWKIFQTHPLELKIFAIFFISLMGSKVKKSKSHIMLK